MFVMKEGPLADHWGEMPNQLPQIIKMGTRDEVQWVLMIAGHGSLYFITMGTRSPPFLFKTIFNVS